MCVIIPPGRSGAPLNHRHNLLHVYEKPSQGGGLSEEPGIYGVPKASETGFPYLWYLRNHESGIFHKEWFTCEERGGGWGGDEA